MLEKDSWSYRPDDIFPDSKSSGNCFRGNFTEAVDKAFCEDDAMLDNRDAAIDSSLYHFPLADISPTNGDLDIFGNEHENQECSYLSCDGWPDVCYIEDFDGLFRSCDSKYGQETIINDDEMSWFSSSSHAIHGFGEASVPVFKSSCSGLSSFKSSLKHHDFDMYHLPHSAISDSDEKDVLGSNSSLHHSSYGNCLEANAESISEPISEKQPLNVNGGIVDKNFPIIKTNSGSSEMHGTLRRKQIKNHKYTEAKRKTQFSEYSSAGSFLVPGTPPQFANPTKMSSDSSSNVIAPTHEENVEKLHWKHHLQAISSNKSQHEDLMNHAAFTDQVHILKRLHQTEDGDEGHCEVEKVSTVHPDVDTDSSVILEFSGMSSVGSGKISEEETSFLQLQYVTEQLDVRTKLCIRDSLYRLARSAEQRNNMEHSGSSSRDERDRRGIRTTEESNKCTGFMDVETDTNPIDRSIAHLLFHKPIEGTSLNSHASIGRTFPSQPVVTRDMFCQENFAGGVISQNEKYDQYICDAVADR